MMSLDAVSAVVGGSASGEASISLSAISTDSRTITAGDLFVALVGERFDGHDHCAAAMAAGAVAVVVDVGRTDVAPRIEVASTKEALLALAVHRRSQIDVPVIAITGSTGKTSTKDMVGSAMGPDAWASPASYNNEIGVPLTVLRAPDTASSLVVEVGSRGLGHIATLAPAIRPSVAVVTNLGVVHLETFGSTSNLATAKGELIDALGPDGVAVLPAAETRLAFAGREVRFGVEDDADVRVTDIALDAEGRASFVVDGFGEKTSMNLKMAGAHQPLNAAAALAAAVCAGQDWGVAVAGIERATGSPWRMEVHSGRFTVINDAYNANPTSVAAALRTAAAMGDLRMAVLGIMAELGPVSESEHRKIGRLARELGFDPVIIVGEAPGLGEGAGDVALAVHNIADAHEAVRRGVQPGSIVLVKGSRVAGLEVLAAALVEEAGA